MAYPQQPNPYQQPGPGYGPPPQGHPPQYGPGGPPASGRGGKGLIIGLIVVVVLIGGGAAAYFFLGNGGGGILGTGNDPRSVAEAFVNGRGKSNQDILCSADRNKLKQLQGSLGKVPTPTNLPKANAKTTLKSVDVPSGADHGTFTVNTDLTVLGKEHSQDMTYDLVKENGDWKVCGITKIPNL